RSVPGVGHQIGLAGAHDPNADGNLSWPRRWSAGSAWPNCARHCRANRRGRLVQDLRGFTRITDTEPERVVSLLNDYSDVIVSRIQEHGGDVLKLIGDGTLAIFTAENRAHSCSSALAAAIAAREGVAKLNNRRSAEKKPTTDMYLGLHVGEVFYGKCWKPRTA